MMVDKVPATLRATRMLSTPDATPSRAPPGTAKPKRGSKVFHALPGDTAALTARPNASKATASFSKLSPWRTAIVRRGKLNSRSTAAAAATAAVVSNTSTTASEVSGNQLRSISRGGMSKAVSMTAGATNKANARRGSMLK